MAQPVTLHFADQTFEMAEDWTEVARKIAEKIKDGGGWADALTTVGGISFWVHPGIHIWFQRHRADRATAPVGA